MLAGWFSEAAATGHSLPRAARESEKEAANACPGYSPHKEQALVSIHPDASVLEAAAMIADRKVGMLLVINDDKKLVGLLSERDILSYVATRDENALASRVEAAMTGIGMIARPEDSVAIMMQEMTNRRARHLLVISDRRLVGVINIGDILRSRLAEKDQETAVLRDIARVSIPTDDYASFRDNS